MKISRLPVFLLILLFLSSCASAENSAGPTATPLPILFGSPTAPATVDPAATATPQLVPLSEVDPSGETVLFWYVWNLPEADPFPQWIAAFNGSNQMGITVTGVNQIDLERLDTALTAQLNLSPDGLPDVVIGQSQQYLRWHGYGDLVVDLNRFVMDETHGYAGDLANLVFGGHVVDGYRYGVPAWGNGSLLFFNSTWARELDFYSTPSTSDEFIEQACAAAEANGDGTGGWVVSTEPGVMLSWLRAFEVSIETDAGAYAFETKPTSEAFEFLDELFAGGCAWVSAETYPDALFAERQALFVSGTLLDLPYQQAALDEAENEDRWQALGYLETPVNVLSTAYLILDGDDPQNLASWLFVSHLISQPVQREWVGFSGLMSPYLGTGDVAGLPQWSKAVSLILDGEPEPARASWEEVQWAVSEAGGRIFRFGFEADQIDFLVSQLQDTAAEYANLKD